jgi:ABC-type phosphate transport system permease subunit
MIGIPSIVFGVFVYAVVVLQQVIFRRSPARSRSR